MKRKCMIAMLAMMCICGSMAGCGSSDSNSKKTNTTTNNEIVNELSADEKKELEEVRNEMEAELNEVAAKDDDAKTEAVSENLGLKDPKYYTYYEELAKGYAESNITKHAGTLFYSGGVSELVYANDKVYFTSAGNDKQILYSYDIASGTMEKAFEFNSAESEKNIYDYDSWYVNGDDLYLVYSSSIYGENHIEKVGQDGSILEDYDISGGFMISQITNVFDNGKILLTTGGDDNFELYDPADNTLTTFEVIPVPSDHEGVTQDAERPMFLFAKGNSFYFIDYWNNMKNNPVSRDQIIYEYNTDSNETSVFVTDDVLKYENPTMKILGNYLMLEGEYTDTFLSVINLNDGTKIIDASYEFSPYLGGDCSYYRDYREGKWYKLRYPDSTYEGKIEKVDQLKAAGEELSSETSKVGTVNQLNDKYYVVHDDAGFFLRTYEKGEAEEQVIITQNQIDEDLQ